jgi:hypothetical protein
MDDLRHDHSLADYGRFLSWHYIDLPIDPRDPMPSFQPGTDNDVRGDAVQALKRARVVLEGGTDPYITSQPMALAIVEHLVGDLHQPLHCSTQYFFAHGKRHDDRGGNEEFVLNGPPGDDKFNLHAFWDDAWRASFDEASGNVVLDPKYAGMTEFDPALVRDTALAFARDNASPGADLAPNFDAWAREGSALARDFVYPGITVTGNWKECRLGSSYVAHARELARQRLVLAGNRLAALLNATLGTAAPAPPPPSYPAGPPTSGR